MKKRNVTHFPFWLFVVGIPLALFLSATLGMMDTPDSYLYFILAGYLKTGQIGWVAPFNYTKPQTLFGPVYGLFGSYASNMLPLGIVSLPFLQLLMVLISGFLMYKVIQRTLNTTWAIVGTIVFFLLPFNLIYATLIMSETLTQLWVSLFIIILYFTVKRSSWWANPSVLILIATIATLTRYAYGLLIIVSIVLCFLYIPKRFIEYLCIAGSIAILVWWTLFNYRTNGVISLSVVQGRHLYNNVIYDAHLLPPETLPIVKTFLKYFPSKDAFYQPWWVNQNYFAVDKNLPEWKIDAWYTQISLAGIQYHPLAYAWHVVSNIFVLPTQVPYYKRDSLYIYATCNPAACLVPWNPVMCQPKIRICPMQTGWAKLITAGSVVQPFVGLLSVFLTFIGVGIAFFKKGTKFYRISVIIFLSLYISQSALEIKEGRFLIPLYPFYALFIPLAVSSIAGRLRQSSGKETGMTQKA